MVQEHPPALFRPTWQALTWRLILTLLLLLFLAGPGLTAFNSVTTASSANTLPAVTVSE